MAGAVDQHHRGDLLGFVELQADLDVRAGRHLQAPEVDAQNLVLRGVTHIVGTRRGVRFRAVLGLPRWGRVQF